MTEFDENQVGYHLTKKKLFELINYKRKKSYY